MIHVSIERHDLREAVTLARSVYIQACEAGRHVLMDAPGDFRTNMPERRLSAADIVITARQAVAIP